MEKDNKKPNLSRFLNMHTALIAVFIIVVCVCFSRLSNWGVQVDLEEIFKDGPGTYEDTLDSILPLIDDNGQIVEPANDAPVIVAFGNNPFADDRDSEDNLCNLIAQETGATVYNCSVNGSYLAAQLYGFNEDEAPFDAYCFYWLAALACDLEMDPYHERAERTLGGNLPAGAIEAVDTLESLDFNEVDVITIMYDATDYLMGNPMNNDANPTDTLCFTGNLEAGIELFQTHYPHIRIIVMSPTYAFAVDEDGNYVSSDMYTYGEQDVLSTYSILESGACFNRSVTFIDHLYGTITEDNAKKYLSDNIHLNVKGRKLVAERFEYALNYYTKGYAANE